MIRRYKSLQTNVACLSAYFNFSFFSNKFWKFCTKSRIDHQPYFVWNGSSKSRITKLMETKAKKYEKENKLKINKSEMCVNWSWQDIFIYIFVCLR